MFEEAHDFIIQAWTRPGPWRYEGKHFHYRHVNPWALPYQKPHPPMWIPGTLSPETVRWCAEKAYPYFGLGTSLGPTCDLWDYYADEAAKHGYEAGSENFGYVLPTFVAETEEKAQELGQELSVRRRPELVRARRAYAAAGIQLEGGDSEAGEAAARQLARNQRRQNARAIGGRRRSNRRSITMRAQKLIPGYRRRRNNYR